MFFVRTYKFDLGVPREEFMKRLAGKHVTIHNLDFEVYEQDERMCIAPHAEQVTEIKTLPLTWIDFRSDGGGTKVVMQSKIRSLDAGGPNLIMIFCIFLLLCAIILGITGGDMRITYAFLAVDLLVYVTFWVRMKRGYLDYVHKIRDYVKVRTK